MAFTKAERTNLYLRCALFGPSGSGKTMTALRIAKGIADRMGVPFAVIDTEARSASKYADRFTFAVDDLREKTIDHYIASMNECIEAGYQVLVIDSLTHAWRELTDEVDRIAEKSVSKNSFSPWAKVNPKQKRFIDAILNFPGHVIATMRSSTEWVVGDRNGKSVPEKIGLKPEQGKGIEFEFDLLIELDQKHQAAITKDRTGKFQDEAIDRPGEAFGAALYDWLSTGSPAVLPPAPVPLPSRPAAGTGKKKPPETAAGLKERGNEIIRDIGTIITSAAPDGRPYFTETEKEEIRQIIKTTKLVESGIQELASLKDFLSEERAKREPKIRAA
jgi:hypothetical protein